MVCDFELQVMEITSAFIQKVVIFNSLTQTYYALLKKQKNKEPSKSNYFPDTWLPFIVQYHSESTPGVIRSTNKQPVFILWGDS